MSITQDNMPYSWSASDAADRLKENRLSYTPLQKIDIDLDEKTIVEPNIIGQMQRMLIIDDSDIYDDDEEEEEEDYTNLPQINNLKQKESDSSSPDLEHIQYINTVRKTRPLPQIPQRTTSKELPKNMTEVFADSFKNQNKLTAQQLFEIMCNNRVDDGEPEEEDDDINEELDEEEDYYDGVYAFKTQVPSPEISKRDPIVYSPYHHYDHFNAHAYKMMTPVEEVDEEDQLYADYQFEEQQNNELSSTTTLEALNLSACKDSLCPQSELYLSTPSLTSGCTSSSCRSVESIHRDDSDCNDVEYYNEERSLDMQQQQEECELQQYQNPQQQNSQPQSLDESKPSYDNGYFNEKRPNQNNDHSETSLVSDVQRLSQLNQALMTPILSNNEIVTYNHTESMSSLQQTQAHIEKTVTFTNEYRNSSTSSPLAMTSFSLTHDKEAIKTYRRMATKTHDKNVQFTYAKYLLQLVSLYNTNSKINIENNSARDRLQEEAEYWIEKLAKGNYAEALYIKGQWHSHFLNSSAFVRSQYKKTNHTKAFKCFQQAAKFGSIEAYYELAEYYQSHKEYKKAMSSYRYAASKNHILSLYKLANILLRGLLNQEKDINQGMIYLKTAADINKPDSARSAYDLACIYSNDFESIGLDSNTMMATRTTNQTHNSLAVKYFKIADSLGLTAATFRLGRIIEHGSLGMEANPSEAFKYYTKAAEKNNVESMLELSRLCKDGIPGYLNAHPVMAHTWCIKASERGNEVAEYLMGMYYEIGVGVHPDLPRALEWYSKSASKGFGPALERMKDSSNNKRMNTTTTIDNMGNQLTKYTSRGGHQKKKYYEESIRIAEKSRKAHHTEQNCQVM